MASRNRGRRFDTYVSLGSPDAADMEAMMTDMPDLTHMTDKNKIETIMEQLAVANKLIKHQSDQIIKLEKKYKSLDAELNMLKSRLHETPW